MVHSARSKSRITLKTIENPSVDAYRQHLKDRSTDYHVEVKRESNKARRSLREKARSEALRRHSHSKLSHAENIARRRRIKRNKPNNGSLLSILGIRNRNSR